MAATRGVIYVAVGDPAYAGLARDSIASLRRSGYDGPVAVVCDDDRGAAATAREFGAGVRRIPVPRDADPFGSRALKTRLHQLTPFDETLYLDCDTLILWPIGGIWDYLRGAGGGGGTDLAMALDPHPTVGDALAAAPRERRGSPAERDATCACGAAAAYYNGGVVLWRTTDASNHFFEAWHAEWQRFRGIDQFALVRALMRCGRRVATLPPRFNTPSVQLPNAAVAARAGVSVLHFCPHAQQRRMAEFARELRFDVHLMTLKGGGEATVL